jgi:peptide chain release factor 2
MQELGELKDVVGKIRDVESKIDYFLEIIDIYIKEGGGEDLKNQIFDLGKEIEELEKYVILSDEYDKNDVILSISAGAGGVDAQDWSEMLLRMYMRYAQKKGFKVKIIDESRGAEAGIKSAILEINGLYAYGLLRSEAGAHRLVRLSPFNSDNLRQTSFALVEVLPIVKDLKEIIIADEDLKIDTYRSSGAGGQSVNTTDSAVRITHLPSNTIATCQSERSQLQNKEKAFKILLAKLHKQFLQEKELAKKKLKGVHIGAQWGSQIRSYVLHPYKLVKDHRSGFESSNPEEVLNGEIDGFVENFLRKNSKL